MVRSFSIVLAVLAFATASCSKKSSTTGTQKPDLYITADSILLEDFTITFEEGDTVLNYYFMITNGTVKEDSATPYYYHAVPLALNRDLGQAAYDSALQLLNVVPNNILKTNGNYYTDYLANENPTKITVYYRGKPYYWTYDGFDSEIDTARRSRTPYVHIVEFLQKVADTKFFLVTKS